MLPSERGSEKEKNKSWLKGISIELIPEKLQALHGAGTGNWKNFQILLQDMTINLLLNLRLTNLILEC